MTSVVCSNQCSCPPVDYTTDWVCVTLMDLIQAESYDPPQEQECCILFYLQMVERSIIYFSLSSSVRMHCNPVWAGEVVVGAFGDCLIAFREGGLSPTTFIIGPINWQSRGGGDSLSSFTLILVVPVDLLRKK